MGKYDDLIAAVGRAAPPPKYIRAYHGSPHDFDVIDFDKLQTGLFGPGFHVSDYEPWVDANYRKGGRVYEVEIDASPAEFLEKHVTQPTVRSGRDEEMLRGLLLEAYASGDMSRTGVRMPRAVDLLTHIENSDAVRRIEAAQRAGTLPDDSLARRNTLESMSAAARQTARDAAKRAGVVGLRGEWMANTAPGLPDVPMQIYSVFDPERIRILRKYGLLAPMAAGAMEGQE
jgi:hypothetical protein